MLLQIEFFWVLIFVCTIILIHKLDSRVVRFSGVFLCNIYRLRFLWRYFAVCLSDVRIGELVEKITCLFWVNKYSKLFDQQSRSGPELS